MLKSECYGSTRFAFEDAMDGGLEDGADDGAWAQHKKYRYN